jgi:ABC-type antimicrobial peptide transport system permease subunit
MNVLTLSQQIICSLSITIVGLFAGIMLGVAITQQAGQQLSGECWTARQNCSHRLFRKVMPFAFVLTIVSLIAATVVLTDAARVSMGMSCFAFLLVIAITFAVEVPQ